jgi:hypothetical protein
MATRELRRRIVSNSRQGQQSVSKNGGVPHHVGHPRYTMGTVRTHYKSKRPAVVCNLFRPRRHLLTAAAYRAVMRERVVTWAVPARA